MEFKDVSLYLSVPPRLASKGVDVPREVLEACQRLYLSEVDADLHQSKIEDEAVVMAFLESHFAPLMVPGDGYPEDAPPADWKPCGQADGVIYFGKLEDSDTESFRTLLFKSRGKDAFRYLKPASKLVMAEKKHYTGISKISVHGLFKNCQGIRLWRDEIIEEQKKSNQPMHAFFTYSARNVDAVQPAHKDRWIVIKAEEGIWAIFYI